MPEMLSRVWEFAGATGGAFALAFIVMLASGLVLLALMFAGAAVVVLERFARQVRRLRSVVIAALLVAGMLTFVALQMGSARRARARRRTRSAHCRSRSARRSRSSRSRRRSRGWHCASPRRARWRVSGSSRWSPA